MDRWSVLLVLLLGCGDDAPSGEPAAPIARSESPALGPQTPDTEAPEEDGEGQPTGVAEEEDGESPEDETRPEIAGCASHGTPEELSATPREDAEAELLALELSDGLVADQAIYDRVLRDLARIRSTHEDVASVTRPGDRRGSGRNLLVSAEERIARRIRAGRFGSDWRCLNEHYELERSRVMMIGDSGFISLTFAGRYDLGRVAEDYRALPGVESAGPDMALDGPDICIGEDGDSYQYVFDDASGDCMSGCIDHVYTYFRVSPDGSIRRVGSWERGSRRRRPDWVELCD